MNSSNTYKTSDVDWTANSMDITLDSLDLNSMITSPAWGATGSNISISTAAGSNGTFGNYSTASFNSSPYTFTTSGTGSFSNSNSLHVTGDAEFEGDVKIKGVSLADTLKTITERLAILQPDPAKLEKFAALKKAYDHYKMLERLIGDDSGTAEST
jgi:hypothetical protein